jgi:hypothetical protein
MKIFLLTLFVYSSAFSMSIYEFSNDNSFNAVLSIYITATVIIAPMFAMMAFFRN